jgi:hypothetical protein
MKKLLYLLSICLAFSISSYAQGPLGFAALPTQWVDNSICNPPGNAYDVTIVLDGVTSTNNGPNLTSGGIGSKYPNTVNGLLDAMNNWRDNGANANGGNSYTDAWWLIKIPSGSLLHGNTLDSNQSLVTLPGKLNGSTEPTKCLVLESTTPLPVGQMACGRGLPGFGGARNPGCTSPNDKANMWRLQLDGPLSGVGKTVMTAGQSLIDPAKYTNHVVVRDVELTVQPGAAQSAAGSKAVRYFVALSAFSGQSVFGVGPTLRPEAHVIGLDRYYAHGWNPGDPGQPSGSGPNGACSAWTKSGTVTTTDNHDGTFLITRATGSYFGLTFTVGSPVTINGNVYTITNSSDILNGVSNSTFTVSGPAIANGTYSYTESNPPAQYAIGCGDDSEVGVVFDCDYCWRMNGYIEKIHWWANESHSSSQGFDNGPQKFVNNWEEGGSAGWFSGGGAVDSNGGPGGNMEIRRNYFGRDLSWRNLSAGAGQSPSPPWGCGPIDGNGSHDTCPFNYAIKNSIELKLGHNVLVDGNIIENNWSDAQPGSVVVINARTCSGGSVCGIFDPNSTPPGLPKTGIDNIRFSNNWIRNSPKTIEMANRSGIPGEGGGLSLPVRNNDFINNAQTNVGDTNQFGNPGNGWQFVSGSNLFNCNMSSVGTTVTASCFPGQADITGHIGKIASVNNVVTITYTQARLDPMLCLTTPTLCIANGQTLIISKHPGWNGVFAMADSAGKWAADGTGGNNIVYTDNINNPGTATLCSNTTTCAALLGNGDVVYTSLGYKLTDILVNDNVYAHNITKAAVITSVSSNGTTASLTLSDNTYTETNSLVVGQSISISKLTGSNSVLNCTGCIVTSVSGSNPQVGFTVSSSANIVLNTTAGQLDDNTCTASGYAVGSSSANTTYAQAGTLPNGLTVVYTAPSPTGTAKCIIENGAGQPKNVTIQNNTVLSPSLFAITSFGQFWQSSGSRFFKNVFITNDTGRNSDVTCTNQGGGTSAFTCWDPNTFEYWQNVMPGQLSTAWSTPDPLGLCPGCLNYFPPNGSPSGFGGGSQGVNCATGTANPNCLGFSGFMNGASALVTFPTGPCPDANAPYNCPLMSLPYADNLRLSHLSYVGSSSYSAFGVNTAQMTTAMTQTLYICPIGANCGPHGPYPDGGVNTGLGINGVILTPFTILTSGAVEK